MHLRRATVVQPAGWVMDDDCTKQLIDETSEEGDTRPFTVTFRKLVPDQRVASFKAWQELILVANRGHDGFLGANVFHESTIDAKGTHLFVVILKYDSVWNATKWNKSPERAECLRKLTEMTGLGSSGEAEMSIEETPMFRNLLSSASKKGFWNDRRAWFLIWFQVFALVELYNIVLPVLFGLAGIEFFAMNFHVQLLISSCITTMTIDLLTNKIFFYLAGRVGWV